MSIATTEAPPKYQVFEVNGRPAIIEDDCYLDAETGEILHIEGAPEGRFEVGDQDGANWVLELDLEEESAILALEEKRDAIVANINRLITGRQRRRAWIARRFFPGLKQWAAEQLEGKRTRTLQLAFGKVSFRKTKGSSRITDKAAALAFVRRWSPSSIRVTEHVVNESIAEAMELASEVFGREPDVSAFFERTGPGESVEVESGLRSKAKGKPAPVAADEGGDS